MKEGEARKRFIERAMKKSKVGLALTRFGRMFKVKRKTY